MTFLDYVATDVVKNIPLSAKAKLLKTIMSAESGYISESITQLSKVANTKDLPILWLESSDFLKKEKGMNWVQEMQNFDNFAFWNEGNNKTAVDELKKLTLRSDICS